MEILERRVGALHEIISELTGRLTPILNQAYPQMDEKDEAQQPIAELADGIRVQRYRIEGASNRLRGIIDRLEV
jgi:hypothetical protein